MRFQSSSVGAKGADNERDTDQQNSTHVEQVRYLAFIQVIEEFACVVLRRNLKRSLQVVTGQYLVERYLQKCVEGKEILIA